MAPTTTSTTTAKIAWTAAALLFMASLAPVAAHAEAAKAKPGHQCFWPSEVNGFTSVDDRHVNLHVGVKDVYQVELLSPCPDIKWTEKLGLDTRGSTMVCTGLDVTIVSPSPIGPQRCPARNLRKLTPEEIAAQKHRAKP
jgi:hypothetical protein